MQKKSCGKARKGLERHEKIGKDGKVCVKRRDKVWKDMER
jgi:hypothetical protein